jgi:zinc transport system substrate-binding protein
MYLMSGLPFERILIKKITTSHKKLTIVDVTKQISFWESDHYLDAHDCFGNHTDAHDHARRDPHFWLGALQLRQFITAAARVIIDTDPTHTATYQKNTARLLSRLETVHTQNSTLLRPYRNRIFFAYHPSFGYFARTYGLRQQTVEINGRQPGPRSIAALVKQARAADVRTIFVQPQYDTKGAQAIATAINGTVMPLDPLAKDVIQNLETMAGIIARSFMQEPSQP